MDRLIQLTRGTTSVNWELEARARALAGIKGYVTNLRAWPDGTPVTAEFVIGSYHRFFEIEKSFRMSKHDLQARPVYHHQREHHTGWSIRKFVKTARRYRTIEIQVGDHFIYAADPCPTTSTKPSTASTAIRVRTK